MPSQTPRWPFEVALPASVSRLLPSVLLVKAEETVVMSEPEVPYSRTEMAAAAEVSAVEPSPSTSTRKLPARKALGLAVMAPASAAR